MSRLDNAYQHYDQAIKELIAASEEAAGTQESWIVSHYATVVGQQRFTDEGPPETVETLILPFNGPLTYMLKGLILEIPELVESISYADAECTEEQQLDTLLVLLALLAAGCFPSWWLSGFPTPWTKPSEYRTRS